VTWRAALRWSLEALAIAIVASFFLSLLPSCTTPQAQDAATISANVALAAGEAAEPVLEERCAAMFDAVEDAAQLAAAEASCGVAIDAYDAAGAAHAEAVLVLQMLEAGASVDMAKLLALAQKLAQTTQALQQAIERLVSQ
jgi:hypothetical protein